MLRLLMYPCISKTPQCSFALARNTAVLTLPEGNITFAFLSSADMSQTIGFVFVAIRSRRGRVQGVIPSLSCCERMFDENNKTSENVKHFRVSANKTFNSRSQNEMWMFVRGFFFPGVNDWECSSANCRFAFVNGLTESVAQCFPRLLTFWGSWFY